MLREMGCCRLFSMNEIFEGLRISSRTLWCRSQRAKFLQGSHFSDDGRGLLGTEAILIGAYAMHIGSESSNGEFQCLSMPRALSAHD